MNSSSVLNTSKFSDLEQAFQDALTLHKLGQISRAQSLYKQILDRNSSHFDSLHLLGLTYIQTGALEIGAQHISQAVTMRPDYPEAYYNLGNALLTLKKPDGALVNFDTAIRLKPNDPAYHFERANALTELGRLDEAITSYSKAISLKPTYAQAYNNRGIALKEEGRFDEALKNYDKAINFDSRYAEAHSNRGNVLKELNRLDEAVASHNEAIRLKPTYAEAHYNLGNALMELKRLDEALASYGKSIRLKPNYAEAYFKFGNALVELKRLDEALASYDKAIKLKPDYTEAYSNRGRVLRDLSRDDEAIVSYNRAISLKPDYIHPWLALARIDSETGRFQEAQEKYERARLLDPNAVEPLCGIAVVKKFDGSDPFIQEFEKLLSDGTLSDQDRARLHHAYAKICNDLGNCDDSISHFSIGKRLLRSGFDIERHSMGYSAIRRLFTRQFFAERSGFGLPDERPVFVVGMPRSGTTLTEQILASHNLVDGLGELRDIPQIMTKLGVGFSNPSQLTNAIVNLRAADLNNMAERYCEVYKRARRECIRLVDKRPHNYEWLGLIALMFPNAHIIHCRRHPLDNTLSIYMQNFNESHGYNQDFAVLGRYYREYEALMDHWSKVLPLPVYECVYESTVNNFETSVRSLVSFLGLDWDPNCLNYYQQERQVSTPSRWQVRQPLYDKSVGRWRRYEKHLGPLKEALGIQQPNTSQWPATGSGGRF